VTALRKETGREFRGILKLFLANCASQFFKLHFKVINNLIDMADESTTRLRTTSGFPKVVMLESLAIFFAAQFMMHQNVFRKSGNRL
jgi:hypothetical protein